MWRISRLNSKIKSVHLQKICFPFSNNYICSNFFFFIEPCPNFLWFPQPLLKLKKNSCSPVLAYLSTSAGKWQNNMGVSIHTKYWIADLKVTKDKVTSVLETVAEFKELEGFKGVSELLKISWQKFGKWKASVWTEIAWVFPKLHIQDNPAEIEALIGWQYLIVCTL